jgi:uncharacterized membrane protein YhhN
VNAPTAVAFVVAGIFAVLDWTARARANRRLEIVAKPATLVALTVAAIVLDPAAGADARRAWFVAALVFSLAGDVFLLRDEWFVPGLAAFLVAHICYIVGFWTDGPDALAFAVSVVVVLLIVTPLARRILGALREEPALRPPVAAYIVTISAMLATALAIGNPFAAIGAALFVSSDSMIAWNRFVRAFDAADVAIMVTYHLGQALLVVSLLR